MNLDDRHNRSELLTKVGFSLLLQLFWIALCLKISDRFYDALESTWCSYIPFLFTSILAPAYYRFVGTIWCSPISAWIFGCSCVYTMVPKYFEHEGLAMLYLGGALPESVLISLWLIHSLSVGAICRWTMSKGRGKGKGETGGVKLGPPV